MILTERSCLTDSLNRIYGMKNYLLKQLLYIWNYNNFYLKKIYITGFLLSFLIACQPNSEVPLFLKTPSNESGINFVNDIENSEDFNIFNYRNFYNGGGVGLGDINNDGLLDIYFTANQGSNKLYKNKGDFTFEDITESSGVAVHNKWSTGVSLVDINYDGFLDIYVCNAGYVKGKDQKNSLFVNNGDETFTERAVDFGLDHNGYSTHAAFFDYDKDGDLDAYILNNSFIPVNTLNYSNKRDLKAADWPVKDFLKGGGDVLLKNEKGVYADATEEAGIYSSLIGFGLGITVGDVNNDYWDDLYISNDFFERDYLYINQTDGTFTEELEQRIGHISLSSMGADMADLNNDGSQEIFVTDMLPNDEYRLKTTSSYESIDVFTLKQQRGFYNQFMQNTLQLNNGKGQFKEIAHHANIQASDWSWGALLFDADNDSYHDIFIANGILNDVIDQDFIDFFANDIIQKMVLSGKKEKIDSIIHQMPSVPVANQMYQNHGNLQFKEVGENWGLDEKTFSNGAAYGDLDNDGDLDLVINNVNQPVLIYKNTTTDKNYLQLKLRYKSPNLNAIGATVIVYADSSMVFKRSIQPHKGFQSSVDSKITIGLGNINEITHIEIIWSPDEKQIILSPEINQLLTIQYNSKNIDLSKLTTQIPKSNTLNSTPNIQRHPFEKHEENDYKDFYFERNIPELLSKEGFTKHPQAIFNKLKAFEETAAAFFDVDNDKDMDLFIGSGGNQLPANNRGLEDHLLLNDGDGNFELAFHSLPKYTNNTAVIAPNDFDGDGDMDVFVGSRNYPLEYGVPPFSFLLINKGNGQFEYLTKLKGSLPPFSSIGMVTDAKWLNTYGDKRKELVIIGDWMAPTIYHFNDTTFIEITSNLKDKQGFWRALDTSDFNEDGNTDLILGNIGSNFSLPIDSLHPLKLYINDFDGNGFVDKVLAKTIEGKEVPVMLKRKMSDQFAFLKKKNLKHSEYAKQTIQDIFDANALNSAIQKTVNYPYSIIAYGHGNGQFTIEKLPIEAQLSCINDFYITKGVDESFQIYAGGNNFNYLPQFGRLDACSGWLITKTKKYSHHLQDLSNLQLKGQLRYLDGINLQGEPHLLVIENNQIPQLYPLENIY